MNREEKFLQRQFIENQPVGLLEQMGELLGEPVGLGEYRIEDKGFGVKAIMGPILAGRTLLGTFTMYAHPKERVITSKYFEIDLHVYDKEARERVYG